MRTVPELVLSISLLLCSMIIMGQHPGERSKESIDRAILEEVFSLFGDYQDKPAADLLLLIAGYFEGSPYVERSLEQEPENLVVNLREFDCTTYMESCLAISRTILSGKLSFEKFCSELTNIRYREGEINGYTSRIHYFSDWIYLSDLKSIVSDNCGELGGSAYTKEINFMSTHPSSYLQLHNDPGSLKIIADQEKEISSRDKHYISLEQLAFLAKNLEDGDIVGITTSIKGLDVTHVGMLERIEGSLHLWHASSRLGKVVLSEETLETYLENNKSASGIMLARPL